MSEGAKDEAVQFRLVLGDCVDVLKKLPDCSVDAVVTDPPYGIGFMGKEWDAFGGSTGMKEETRVQQRERYASEAPGAPRYAATARPAKPAPGEMLAFQEWCVQWAAECLRVLKPGGHLLAFGGTRTYHRMACAIEDAGFEVRDSIHWMYGSGFPKSKNIGGGLGTALKPAHEPIVVTRKPLIGTVAQNVLEHGTGAINVDGCRVGFKSDADKASAKPQGNATAKVGALAGGTQNENERTAFSVTQHESGRWPPNVIFSHLPECLETECAEGCAVAELDAQSGFSKTPAKVTRGAGGQHGKLSPIGEQRDVPCHNDSGGASRFFPAFRYQAKAPAKERKVEGISAQHPTQKPVELMRWLVRLVTPPGGVVLDPFTGSGTTGVACIREGFHFLGIEREPEYEQIARARILNEGAHDIES